MGRFLIVGTLVVMCMVMIDNTKQIVGAIKSAELSCAAAMRR